MRRIKKYCPLCGIENPVEAKFCESCGSPFEESSIREVDEQNQTETRIKEGSDISDGSDSSDSSDGSDSSNASLSRPLTYLFSFSLMFILAILFLVIFY